MADFTDYESDFERYPPDETIRKIIGRNKIKYKKLNDLLDDINISNLKSFLINGDSILLDTHKFLKKYGKNDLYDQDIIYAISSSIINTIAHYRYYFICKNEYPNIYFFADMSDDHPCIKKAIEITKIILKYIPHAYFINTKNCITGISINYFKSNKNLILTRDEFDLMMLDECTSIIKAYGDKSKVYSIDNWQSIMCGKNFDKKYYVISNNFINIIECFVGAHGREGVKGIGKRTMLKLLYKALNKNYINNMLYTNINDFINDMKDLLYKYRYQLDKAVHNFEIYDINTNYSKYMTKAIMKRMDSNIEDKFSRKDLVSINTKYFTGLNYLMLDELLMVPNSFKTS